LALGADAAVASVSTIPIARARGLFGQIQTQELRNAARNLPALDLERMRLTR